MCYKKQSMSSNNQYATFQETADSETLQNGIAYF